MANSNVALARPAGKFDIDVNGLARYSLKIEVPRGIGHGNEPELSFEYSQGAPNGALGVGWALGGMSSIRLGPAMLAFDGINNAPEDFDMFTPRLNFDGNLLLNVRGEYFAADAIYRTEIDSLEKVVSVLGEGFVVHDSTGNKAEYGTSTDSRCWTSDGNSVREWHIKKEIDPYGNCVTYNYEQSSQSFQSWNMELDLLNGVYLSSITYTSNEHTGLDAGRLVSFNYVPRKDPVVQCIYGDRIVWSSLLSAIHISLANDPSASRIRSYQLDYDTNPVTAASYVSKITELGYKSGQSLALDPTLFTYNAFQEDFDHFNSSEDDAIFLPGSNNSVMLMNLNISGRGLADIACFRYDPGMQELSIKTFLAEQTNLSVGHGRTVGWYPSQGNGAEVTLPRMDIASSLSKIFAADLNGDGRVDLIVPFEGRNGSVELSVSQSIGTGFQDHKILTTQLPWQEDAKFMALDLTGRGTSEVVQIFSDGNKLALRTYPSIEHEDGVSLEPGATLTTPHVFEGTIEWLQILTQKTGAKCLVRIWEEDIGQGISQLSATTYELQNPRKPEIGFVETATSLIGKKTRGDSSSLSVLSCDINADGVQDIVTCVIDMPGDRIIFKFNTFLGNGLGSFAPLGDSVEKSFEFSQPVKDGSFHVANFGASQTPELSYVFQEASSQNVICFTAQGSHSGLVGDMKAIRVATRLQFEDLQITAADVNGTGISDYFMHTVKGGGATVLTAYNLNELSDFMRSTTTPLGLKTDVTYCPLTNPLVYETSVKWNDYGNLDPDSLPLLAAPNLVISNVTHTNDETRNSLPFKSSLQKLYKNGNSSRYGRGWQGFSSIVTTNFFQDTEPIVVEEVFQRKFPLTGLKTEINTKTLSGPVLKSEKISYKHSRQRLGQWDILRTDRISEQIDMLDDGIVSRTIGTHYVTDAQGNFVQKRYFELQGGVIIHQSWERCTYTSINGISGLQTSTKCTSRESNVDLATYEDGDTSLTLYRYDSQRGTLHEILEWSSDVGAFSSQQFEFDAYGNEVLSITETGLKIMTMYDEEFQTFPIHVIEQGGGINQLRLGAYDKLTGQEVARKDANGLLTCFSYDAFGRCVESKKRSTTSGGSQQASDFLGSSASLLHRSFREQLSNCQLHPHKHLSFEQTTTSSKSRYLCTKSTLESHDGPGGKTEVVEAVNCANMVCRRSCKNGSMSKTWKYWQYNTQGQRILESFPILLPPSVPPTAELDFIPDANTCTRTTFNAISFPVEVVRPAHVDSSHFLVTKATYRNGGSTVEERKFRREGTSHMADQLLSITSKCLQKISGDERTTSVVDENGLKSVFNFDSAGRLIACQDAGGRIETRSYNTRGKITRLHNQYQNMLSDPQLPAISTAYDLAGRPTTEVNALGETVTYEYDLKSRPLRKISDTGRTVIYTYDENSAASLSSVTIFSDRESFESSVSYKYDQNGRAIEKTTSLDGGHAYATKIYYDWQDKVVQTKLPDGAIVSKEWQGELLTSAKVASASSQTWHVQADFSRYNPFDKAEAYKISGSNLKHDFVHEHVYNSQGFPQSHTLNAEGTLVQNDYVYGDLDQLQRVHELVSGQTTDYTYSGQRLAASHIRGGAVTSYTYDSSGNMTSRGGTSIDHEPAAVRGMKDGVTSFNVAYDGAGRMIRRTTPEMHHTFQYDSFGNMSNIIDYDTNQVTRMLCDDQGHTLSRINPDSGQEIFIERGYTVIVKPDGKRCVRYALFNGEELLASVLAEEPSLSTQSQGDPRTTVHYCDTKSNVTNSFKAEQVGLRSQLRYDDYGLAVPGLEALETTPDAHLNTYEGKSLHEKSGLLDFGARWYDPLVGRFATPDNITDLALLYGPDGMNRQAFENNDPINHVDPTGHWSWTATFGVLAGVALIGAGLALTALTGGAAAPLLAVIISGALVSGGIAGATYSIQNGNPEDSGKFWAGWGLTVGINGAIGAVTAGVGAGIAAATKGISSSARLAVMAKWAVDASKHKASMTALRMGGKMLLSGSSGALSKAGGRWMKNVVYGETNDVWGAAGSDFAMGMASGFVTAAGGEIWSRQGSGITSTMKDTFSTWRDGGVSNVHNDPGVWSDMFKNAGKLSDPILRGVGGQGSKEVFRVVMSNPFK